MNISIKSLFSTTFFGWWIVAAVASLVYLFTLQDSRLRFREDRVKFGIDLVGGTYITLQVDTDKAVELELIAKKQILFNKIKEAKFALPKSNTVVRDEIVMTFQTQQELNDVFTFIPASDNDLVFTIEQLTLKAQLKEVAQNRVKQWAVQSNIDVLRSRIDKIGVGEISIAAQGDKNIIVELPNVDDPQKAKAMIGKAAVLEIKVIEKIADDEEKILEDFDGELPDDMMIMSSRESDGKKLYFLVPKYTDLTGRLLKDAYAGFGGELQTEYVVHFEFNPEGAEKFYDLTRNNHNRQVAIILDGVVISYPKITVPIREHGYIHGNFTQESSKELALLLKSGSFVAPVHFVHERCLGPSLGSESIRNGLLACGISLLLLFVFSILLYKLSGFFAFIALIYNLLFILVATQGLEPRTYRL